MTDRVDGLNNFWFELNRSNYWGIDEAQETNSHYKHYRRVIDRLYKYFTETDTTWTDYIEDYSYEIYLYYQIIGIFYGWDVEEVFNTAEAEAKEYKDSLPVTSGVVTIHIKSSTTIETRFITPELGLKTRQDVINYVNDKWDSFAEFIDYNESEVIYDFKTSYNTNNFNETKQLDKFEKYLLDEELFNNSLYKNCVTKLKQELNLSDEFKDGLTLNQFIQLADKYNLEVYNNELMLLNKFSNNNLKCIAYAGHVQTYHSYKLISTNHYLDYEQFEQLWQNSLKERIGIIHDIKVIKSVYGCYLSSFAIDNDKFILNYQTPTNIIKNLLTDFTSWFYHPSISNAAVFSGEFEHGYGFDINACYIECFKAIDKVPIIDNIPLSLKFYEQIYKDKYDSVVICDEFNYKGVHFQSTCWLYSTIHKLGLDEHIKEVHLIKYYKSFDGMYDKIINALNEFEYLPDSDILHNKFLKAARTIDGVRNKWNEEVIRYALGSMIENNLSDIQYIYSAYLDDDQLLNDNLQHGYFKRLTDKPTSRRFYHNIYFAMINNYHELILNLIDTITRDYGTSYITYPIKGIYCDCFYVDELTAKKIKDDYIINKTKQLISNNFTYTFKHESSDITRNCKHVYKTYSRMINFVQGLAGTGKTHYLRELIPPNECLVIIPEMRLSDVWVNYNCMTIQKVWKRYKLPNVTNLIVDECFKFNTDQLNRLIGLCLRHHINIYLAGDKFQLRQFIEDSQQNDKFWLYRIEGIISTVQLTTNHRNNINYKSLNLFGNNDITHLQNLFNQYLSKYIIDDDDLTNPKLFEDINYCWHTNKNGTRDKLDKAYQQYIKRNHYKTCYARCIKNCVINEVASSAINSSTPYYNGVIYKLPVSFVKNNSSKFIISNTYSIYATQGQTMSKIRLVKSDYYNYFSQDWRILYVLISRLS